MGRKSKAIYSPRSKANKAWHPSEKQGVFENIEPKGKKNIGKHHEKVYLDACSPDGWLFIKNNENILVPRNEI